jgi:hypothetical protein
MPHLLPTGPPALAVTYGNGTITLRLCLNFPRFTATILFNVGFTPAAAPFDVGFFINPIIPDNWTQRNGLWTQWDGYWSYGYGLTMKYKSTPITTLL